jgi:Family of unknown function (DUF5939)
MADASGLWALLHQTADRGAVAALEAEVVSGKDHDLNRINPLAFAGRHGLDTDATITTLVHAARLGLFDMSWSMLCPGCGGVLESGVTLKAIDRSQYHCSLCIEEYEPTLDELVEVTFTINRRIRKIAAHDPDTLSLPEFARQVFFSSAVDPPENIQEVVEKATLDMMELGPHERAAMSLVLPRGFVLLFDPVTHSTVPGRDCRGDKGEAKLIRRVRRRRRP